MYMDMYLLYVLHLPSVYVYFNSRLYYTIVYVCFKIGISLESPWTWHMSQPTTSLFTQVSYINELLALI